MTRFGLLYCLILCLLMIFIQDRLFAQVTLQNAFPNLTFSNPVALCAARDTSDRIFVVSQDGIIYVFPNRSSVPSTKVFLDISDSIVSGGELGLLGLAFHPNYQNNGYFYIYYTVNNSVSGFPYASVVARYSVSPSNSDSAIKNTGVVLMRINQPFSNHKGGQLAFGPDGYLYIGLGDGGSGGDPFGNGQNKSVWLGKILRINVDSAAAGLQYSIPSDNPFVHDTTTGVKKEIFAYGLRNPWRYSFDHVMGTLWVSDVGQDLWEEVDTIVNGGNYGWNTMEGNHCYNPSSGCDSTGLKMPLLNYDHNDGRCAVIGGYVYRGQAIPALEGYYIYGDYCAGTVWELNAQIPSPATNTVLLNSGKEISAFGVDKNQELYLVSYGDGEILKFAALPPAAPILLQPTDGQSGVSLNPILFWKSTTNASQFHFQVSTDSLFHAIIISDSTAGDTMKQIGTLSYSTNYYWRVNTSNSGGTSLYSPIWKFKTIDPSAPPPPPVLLSPADGAANQSSIVRLVWGKLPTATSYECQMALDSTFGTYIIDDTALIDTFMQSGPLLNDTIYYWRVRGRNQMGIGSFSPAGSFRTAASSMIFQLSGGWNIVSVPLSVENKAARVLYFGAESNAFSYSAGSGYSISDSLQNGVGYWMKYPVPDTIAIAGTPLSFDSVDVFEGWNIIGSIGTPLNVTAIQSEPQGLVTSQFFQYDKRYSITDTIFPGKGYWVKLSQPGKLFLNSSGLSIASIPKKADVGPIRIEQVLELPPGPPGGNNAQSPNSEIPREFFLEQNYPNPFNPTTMLRYALPIDSKVTMKIYSVLGQVVATLVNGVVSAGYQSAQWNASTVSSGIYFYHIEATSLSDPTKTFTQVKKMLLLK